MRRSRLDTSRLFDTQGKGEAAGSATQQYMFFWISRFASAPHLHTACISSTPSILNYKDILRILKSQRISSLIKFIW